MKKRFMSIGIIVVFAFSIYTYAQKEADTLEISYQENDGGEDIYTGKADHVNAMALEEAAAYLDEGDFFRTRVSYENYGFSIHDGIEAEFRYYFPGLRVWDWHWGEEAGEDRVMVFCGSDGESPKDGYWYTASFLLKQDFSIDVLEETIEADTEKALCVYTTKSIEDADADYAYQGCRISEYRAVYYDPGRDISFDAVIPLFSVKETDRWNEMNRSIMEGLEKWLEEETDYLQGQIEMDYEIKTLDNDLYSILLDGKYENEKEEKDVMIGMTFSMSTGNILPKSVFRMDGQEGDFYDFYIQNDRIRSITGSYGLRTSRDSGQVRFRSYSIGKRERHVYSADGRWIGNCYYELPRVVGCAEHSTKEPDKINEKLESEMGRFFGGVVQEFESVALERDAAGEYESNVNFKIPEGIQKYYCYVESEISYNNNGYIGVVYHYLVDLGEIYESGEASAVYDVESGETVSCQDWQGELLEKIRAQAEQPEEVHRDVFEEYDYVLKEYERACLDDTYTGAKWETVCELAAAYIDSDVFGYCIADLADDGTPELIIGVREREEEEYVVFAIYTYEGGELYLDHYRDSWEITVYQGGIIESVDRYGDYAYSRIQKNTSRSEYLGQITVEEYDTDSQIRYYAGEWSEQREITADEFWDIKNRYTEVPVEFEWKEITGFWK